MRLFFAIVFASVAFASVVVIPRVEDVDSSSYRTMVRGEPACRPYANRVLHPMVVRAVMKTGVGERTAFVVVMGVSALAFYVLLLGRTWLVCPSWKMFFLLLSPLWWVWGGNIYIQDMLTAALTALLFLVVHKTSCARTGPRRWRAALVACVAVTLFLMQLTRESSAVFALALAVLAWRERDSLLAWMSVGAMALGMATVSWIGLNALPSVNELSGLAYMACKVLANGVRNFTGLVPWNDGYAAHLACYYPDPPLWKCTLPAFLQWGNVHEIGIYSFVPKTIGVTFVVWLLYFPGALVLAWRLVVSRKGLMRLFADGGWTQMPLDVRLAFVSGGVFWLLTPFCGPSLMRLAGYSWPLFWVVLPHLLVGGAANPRLPCR